MQRRFQALLLPVLLLTITGCAAKPQPEHTPSAPAEPPPVTAPAPPQVIPQAPEPVSLATICRAPDTETPQALATEINAAPPSDLGTWAKSMSEQVPCLKFSPYEQSDPPLIIAAGISGKERRRGAVLWRESGGLWKAATQEFYEQVEVLRHIPANREWFVASRHDGTGGYGRLIILRDWGGVTAYHVSEMYEKFGVQLLDDHHYVVSGRDTQGAPMASTANCCTPGHIQRLITRQGDGFTVASSRHIPSPHYTFNVFLGALKKGDQEWLAKVAAPEAVAAAQPLQLDSPDMAFTANWGDDLTTAEWNHWSALPAHLNGPAPAQTEVTVTGGIQGVPKATVTLSRMNGDWKVTKVAAAAQ